MRLRRRGRVEAEMLLEGNLIEPAKLPKPPKKKPKTINDMFSILGPHSPYYSICMAMNILIFAVYHHLNEMDNFLIYSKDDHVYTDGTGRIVSPQHPTVVDGNGEYETSNGAMDLTTLTILNNISAILGCVVAVSIARWSYHKTIITFSLLLVTSYLFSQAFLFNFLDRIAFVIGSIFSKALAIVSIQAAFESGLGKYRVLAVGLGYYLSNALVFVTILLFKKESNVAETQYMFIVAISIIAYAMKCPWHLLHCVVRRDIPKIQWILDTYGKKADPTNCDRLVDDILYVNQVPRNAYESLRHLFHIRPFIKKLAALTCLMALQSRLNSVEMEMIKEMLPWSPLESILLSRVAACLTSIGTVCAIFVCGRRRLLLFLLLLNLLLSYTISLVPIDSFSMCFSRDMPGESHAIILTTSFLLTTVVRVSSTITILLMTLEHIPSIHRSFIFPMVMFCDAVASAMGDVAIWTTEQHEYPLFIAPMLRHSMIALPIAALFIDNSDVSVFTTSEIPCYNLKNVKPEVDEAEKKVKDFEEGFRTLCEVKAIEKETFIRQELDKQSVYDTERARYQEKKTTKEGMKAKLKDANCDEETKKNYTWHYWHRREINRKCVDATRQKLMRKDDRTQVTVERILKDRIKS